MIPALSSNSYRQKLIYLQSFNNKHFSLILLIKLDVINSYDTQGCCNTKCRNVEVFFILCWRQHKSVELFHVLLCLKKCRNLLFLHLASILTIRTQNVEMLRTVEKCINVCGCIMSPHLGNVLFLSPPSFYPWGKSLYLEVPRPLPRVIKMRKCYMDDWCPHTLVFVSYRWKLLHNYSRTSLSRTRLFRITAYLEVKIWSLF